MVTSWQQGLQALPYFVVAFLEVARIEILPKLERMEDLLKNRIQKIFLLDENSPIPLHPHIPKKSAITSLSDRGSSTILQNFQLPLRGPESMEVAEGKLSKWSKYYSYEGAFEEEARHGPEVGGHTMDSQSSHSNISWEGTQPNRACFSMPTEQILRVSRAPRLYKRLRSKDSVTHHC